MKYDAIVLGLGAMGSASVYQLARRGARVIGVDRHAPPHDLGSSHGETRITRLAIGEGAHYSPLAIRSHEIWRDIEGRTGADLLTTCGGLFISSPGTLSKTHVEGFFDNTVAAARRFGIAHELLDAAAIRRRYPQFAVSDGETGYFEPTAGFLRPERCIETQLRLAAGLGAELRMGETVRAFEAHADGVTVTTDAAQLKADALIVAAGPWAPDLLGPPFARLLKVYRQVLLWFAPQSGVSEFLPGRFPVFIWELRNTRQGIYGFPALAAEGGVKVASESFDAATTPDAVSRLIGAEEIRSTYEALVAPHIPGLAPHCVRVSTCLYTVAPDFGFVIDRHPDSERVIIASPCSGHGFKHSAAIGEGLAQWALEGRSTLDFGPFALRRFESR